MTRLLVTAHGPDRPGMVAAVTTALAAKHCNLEDTSMTRLGGHFTMMLLVTTASETSSEELRSTIEGLEDLFVTVSEPAPEEAKSEAPVGERWAISLYGADQQGIVSTITSYLAEMRVNIDDLSTRLTGDPAAPVYTMLLDVTIPPGVEGGEVATELDHRASQLGITCHCRPVEVDTF